MLYLQVLEIETAFALQHVTEQQDRSFLPGAVVPGKPFFFVWDNNDINEETLSGCGTTHCTNGIVVQPSLDHVMAAPANQSVRLATYQASKRRRSVNVAPLALPEFVSGAKANPQPMAATNLAISNDALHYLPCLTDFVWILARTCLEGKVLHTDEQSENEKAEDLY